MKPKEVLAELEALGSEKLRARNARNGAGENQYGVKLGDVRKLAKRIKTDHDLGLELWASGNLEARLLATLVIRPEDLAARDLERMVREAEFPQLADWLNAYVVKRHPDDETLRGKWMESRDPMLARAGWSLTAERVARSPGDVDLSGLLDRIESEMAAAPSAAQWTMNACLAAIGIHHEEHRERAVAIGEKLGVYRDHPVPRGCTSPFAPVWIEAMVSRQRQ